MIDKLLALQSENNTLSERLKGLGKTSVDVGVNTDMSQEVLEADEPQYAMPHLLLRPLGAALNGGSSSSNNNNSDNNDSNNNNTVLSEYMSVSDILDESLAQSIVSEKTRTSILANNTSSSSNNNNSSNTAANNNNTILTAEQRFQRSVSAAIIIQRWWRIIRLKRQFETVRVGAMHRGRMRTADRGKQGLADVIAADRLNAEARESDMTARTQRLPSCSLGAGGRHGSLRGGVRGVRNSMYRTLDAVVELDSSMTSASAGSSSSGGADPASSLSLSSSTATVAPAAAASSSLTTPTADTSSLVGSSSTSSLLGGFTVVLEDAAESPEQALLAQEDGSATATTTTSSSATTEPSSSTSSSAVAAATPIKNAETSDSIWGQEGNDPALEEKRSIALYLFNESPVRGLAYMVHHKLLPNNPSRVAQFLYRQPGLNRGVVGEFLGAPDEHGRVVLGAFAKEFDFAESPLDHSLRLFLFSFRIPGKK